VEQVLESGASPWRHHIGLYAYRRDFLLELTELPPSPLEQLEKLEQLRVLEHGATIGTVEVPYSAPGIDTPEDYRQFVLRRGDALRKAG
jgi:3-deoxy-manno-octulosonate cytidylyltransferase (CMP-KDO synthetase)